MQLDTIVDEVHAKYGLGRDRCRQYLGHYLNFYLGDEERQAIQRFAGLAAADALLPSQVKVKFYDLETVG
jgi:predicted solute-binding protein